MHVCMRARARACVSVKALIISVLVGVLFSSFLSGNFYFCSVGLY